MILARPPSIGGLLSVGFNVVVAHRRTSPRQGIT